MVMLVDDDVSAVGTANFDNRSFRLNFEVTALIADREFAARMKAMFDDDFAHAEPIDPKAFGRKPFWWRLGVNVSRLAGARHHRQATSMQCHQTKIRPRRTAWQPRYEPERSAPAGARVTLDQYYAQSFAKKLCRCTDPLKPPPTISMSHLSAFVSGEQYLCALTIKQVNHQF